MSRLSWLGRRDRPVGRHAAGGRARAAGSADKTLTGGAPGTPLNAEPAVSAPLMGAPTIADAPPSSPVTDAARAAVAESAAQIATSVPPGAAPLITIDALGRKCPIPIIMLAGQIGDVPVGSVIAVQADDPAAYTDLPAWCGLKSHDCVFRVDLPSGWSFGIRRRY